MGKEHILLLALVAMTAIAIYLAIALWRVTHRRKRLVNILCRIHACLNITTATLDAGFEKLEDCEAKRFLKTAKLGAHTARDIMMEQLSKIVNYMPYMRDLIVGLPKDL